MTTERYTFEELDATYATYAQHPQPGPWLLAFADVQALPRLPGHDTPIGYAIAHRQEPHLDGISTTHQQVIGALVHRPDATYQARLKIDGHYTPLAPDQFQYGGSARAELERAAQNLVLSWNRDGS